MSTAGLLNRYVWFISTIYNRGPISLADLQHRYKLHFGRGEELGERTFHRYTDAVEELFDVEIKYDRARRGYIVDNREGIDNSGVHKWLLQTFSVNSMLHENQDLKNRILLEDVQSGQQHLAAIVDAMREGVALQMTYQSFYSIAESVFEVEPWCVKYFEHRWYMLGKSEGYDELRIYSLDRIKALKPSERTFKLPNKFDAWKFFADYYGVIINDEDFDVEPVALKVNAWQSKYFRTVPLHHTQVEVECNEKYSIFEYRLCPTFDFQQKLLSMGDSVAVLAPVQLNDILYKKAEDAANNNISAGMGPEYRFRVYKK